MKEFVKKYFNKKTILTYMYGSVASRFLGFFVAMWAAKLVGHYFEAPSFRNLWGLHSHKMLVSKETLANLTWIAQVLIGFFVFEIFHKTLFVKATEFVPRYYKKGMEYLEENGVPEKIRSLKDSAVAISKEKAQVGKEKWNELTKR